jgi:hypothetical protein
MIGAHVCMTSDVDEAPQETKRIVTFADAFDITDVRDGAIDSIEACYKFYQFTLEGIFRKRIIPAFWYRLTQVARCRRAKSVDVESMVEKWREFVVGIALAHDKEEIDKWEAAIDPLLTPMLACPVKELREFYRLLTKTLKADARVPMFLWRMFELWGGEVIETAEDKGIKRLQAKLAREIATLVEADPETRPQFTDAMIGALKWRDTGQLEKVKESLEAGAKPKLVGKQSCLFLVVKDGRKEVASVML